MLMLEETHIYDEIDRYLRGEMSADERKAFQGKLSEDPELRTRLHIAEDVADGLRRRAEKQERIQEWEKTSVKEKAKLPRRIVMTSISVAAAVIAVVTLYVPKSNGVVQDEGFQPNITLTMREGLDLDVHAYWDEGRYEECLDAIGDEIDLYQNEMQSLDASQYEEDEYEYMLKRYEVAVEDLLWAKILTLYKMERYDEAFVLVSDYVSQDSYYQEDVQRLYDYLEKRR